MIFRAIPSKCPCHMRSHDRKFPYLIVSNSQSDRTSSLYSAAIPIASLVINMSQTLYDISRQVLLLMGDSLVDIENAEQAENWARSFSANLVRPHRSLTLMRI